MAPREYSVNTPAATSRRPHGLRHDAIFYDDQQAFASAAVGFVGEGVALGEVVLVNTGTNPVTGTLRDLFAGNDQVVFAENPVYGKPAAVLDLYQRTMDRGLNAGVPGYRAMGFIDFDTGRLPWREWLRYEAVVNDALADFPFQTLCPYDVREVEPEIVEAIRRSHPTLVEDGVRRANPGYLPPAELVTLPAYLPGDDPVQQQPPRLTLEPPPRSVEDVRLELYPALLPTGVPRLKVDDFVKSATEVVLNAWNHGAEPVSLRVWTTEDRLVCTVTDAGAGIDYPLAGYARATGALAGAGLGLWAARQLVDVLDYRLTEDGFTVRLVARADLP
jgi:anti-sigma regulatory factor (Ser/Thr protein kinase)